MVATSPTQPLRRPVTQPLIELNEAGVFLPGRRSPALRPTDLAIGHGELVTLTGPAGSGKSTLLSVLGLLRKPTTGSYLLNGSDTATLTDRERAALRCRLIGVVFQGPQLLLARSGLDNVMLPLLYDGMSKHMRVTAAAGAIARVGLRGRLHDIVGELPAGERQLIAIARAIVTQPSLLLCDDPTASLDQTAAQRIIGLLVSLHKEGRTVLVATRDQLAAAHSSRRVGLGAGGAAGAQDAGR
ncbi:MAG: ATP-binding cassette domain-containing protein [Nocardiopsaceae bacterium]|jgi:putative ABC transport system ATP-binding protein|nr:ATP-binding cassette domain-containing protein [Nocardiopsaceae bacterium]